MFDTFLLVVLGAWAWSMVGSMVILIEMSNEEDDENESW